MSGLNTSVGREELAAAQEAQRAAAEQAEANRRAGRDAMMEAQAAGTAEAVEEVIDSADQQAGHDTRRFTDPNYTGFRG